MLHSAPDMRAKAPHPLCEIRKIDVLSIDAERPRYHEAKLRQVGAMGGCNSCQRQGDKGGGRGEQGAECHRTGNPSRAGGASSFQRAPVQEAQLCLAEYAESRSGAAEMRDRQEDDLRPKSSLRWIPDIGSRPCCALGTGHGRRGAKVRSSCRARWL